MAAAVQATQSHLPPHPGPDLVLRGHQPALPCAALPCPAPRHAPSQGGGSCSGVPSGLGPGQGPACQACVPARSALGAGLAACHQCRGRGCQPGSAFTCHFDATALSNPMCMLVWPKPVSTLCPLGTAPSGPPPRVVLGVLGDGGGRPAWGALWAAALWASACASSASSALARWSGAGEAQQVFGGAGAPHSHRVRGCWGTPSGG